MDRETLRAQCEAYVLGALEGPELQELQALIDLKHPECIAILREATQLIAEIGWSAAIAEPSPLVRTRLMKTIPAAPPSPEPLTAPTRSPRWVAWSGWAIAAGTLLLMVTSRSIHNRQDLEMLHQNASLVSGLQRAEKENERSRKVLAILMARDARIVRLVSSAPEAPQFRAFWSKPAGLVLTGTNVPKPSEGRTMQLWLVPKKGNPISAGVFEPGYAGEVLFLAEVAADPSGVNALAISDEPLGGSAQPTTKPSFVGPLGE